MKLASTSTAILFLKISSNPTALFNNSWIVFCTFTSSAPCPPWLKIDQNDLNFLANNKLLNSFNLWAVSFSPCGVAGACTISSSSSEVGGKGGKAAPTTKESDKSAHANAKSGEKGACANDKNKIDRVAVGEQRLGLNWYSLSRAKFDKRSYVESANWSYERWREISRGLNTFTKTETYS